MISFTQDNRPIRLYTRCLKDKYLLQGLSGNAGISQMYEYDLDVAAASGYHLGGDFAQPTVGQIAASEAATTVFSDLLHNPALVEIDLPDGTVRCIHGVIARVARVGQDNTFTYFRLRLVPHLWLLSLSTRSCPFQYMTVPEIIKAVLANLPMRFELNEPEKWFPCREYVCQYNETDFTFVSRLMEEAGLYYYFEHSEQGEVLIVSNRRQYRTIEVGPASVPFYDVEMTGAEAWVRTWQVSQEVRPASSRVLSYHPQLAHTRFRWSESSEEHTKSGSVIHPRTKGDSRLENHVFAGSGVPVDSIDAGGAEHPDRLKDFADFVRNRALLDVAELGVSAITMIGAGNALNLSPGYKFTLLRHRQSEGEYLVTCEQLTYRIDDNYQQGAGEGLSESTFRCIPAEVAFVPPRLTPKPVIPGTQSAIVTGPPGEEIFVDKYGRVKVRFYWDTTGADDGRTSCWLPVAASLTGPGWGTQYIPRVGEEVVVAFLDGDLDKPLIVGCIRNSLTLPPFPLPESKSMIGIEMPSFPSDGKSAYLSRFDGKAGHEQLRVYCRGEIETRSGRDNIQTTVGTVHTTQRSRSDLTHGDVHIDIEGNSFSRVLGEYRSVRGDRADKVDGNMSIRAGGDEIAEIDGNRIERVGGECVLRANKVVIEAKSGICFQVGNSFLTICEGGVFMSGPEVTQGGSPLSGRQARVPKVPLPVAPLQASHPGDGETGARLTGAPARLVEYWKCPVHRPPTEAEAADKPAGTSWIEIDLNDEDEGPLAGETYEILLPDGITVARGVLDGRGRARIEGVPVGTCKVRFPDFDRDTWRVVQTKAKSER